MSNSTDIDPHEYATEQVNLVGLCRAVILGILFFILIIAMMIVLQTQKRHQTYQEINRLKRELVAMRVEESRLIIEQQMLSATPQVARRSVSELNMYYPSKKEQIRSNMETGSEGGLHE